MGSTNSNCNIPIGIKRRNNDDDHSSQSSGSDVDEHDNDHNKHNINKLHRPLHGSGPMNYMSPSENEIRNRESLVDMRFNDDELDERKTLSYNL